MTFGSTEFHHCFGPRSRLLFFIWATVLLLLTDHFTPALSADSPPAAIYHPVVLSADGTVDSTQLSELSAAIRNRTPEADRQIVLLVHGYNTSRQMGRRQYRAIAANLRREAEKVGLHLAIIGVHWDSYPGPPHRWLPQMLGYRFFSGLGFRNVVLNPYLHRVEMAAHLGRTAFRELLLRLQADFPNTPIHVLAHSMGCDIAVRALSPEVPKNDNGHAPPPVAQPERELRSELVVLAGADLDQDVFDPRQPQNARAALDRARLWWVTVPKSNTADAVLELRRSAGRRDAMGNVGLALIRADFDRLMQRRGLVIDDRQVSLHHDIENYYTPQRLSALAATLLYLHQPENPKAADSALAQVNRMLAKSNEELASHAPASAVARLYRAWRLFPERQRYRAIRIVDQPASPAAKSPPIRPASTGYRHPVRHAITSISSQAVGLR